MQPDADLSGLDLSGALELFSWIATDQGVQDRWFEKTLEQSITLPGSLQAQGFGLVPTLETKWTGSVHPEVLQMPRYAPYREAGQFKMPFWLQPKHYFAGPAWYQRAVSIPGHLAGAPRPAGARAVSLDDHGVGRWPASGAR